MIRSEDLSRRQHSNPDTFIRGSFGIFASMPNMSFQVCNQDSQATDR